MSEEAQDLATGMDGVLQGQGQGQEQEQDVGEDEEDIDADGDFSDLCVLLQAIGLA